MSVLIPREATSPRMERGRVQEQPMTPNHSAHQQGTQDGRQRCIAAMLNDSASCGQTYAVIENCRTGSPWDQRGLTCNVPS